MQKNNVRPRKMLKKKQEYIEVNMTKDKNKYSIYYAGIRNSQQMDTYKSINNRKSLEINNTQPVRTLNTITQLSRPVYRRISYHQKVNGPQSRRYEEQDNQHEHHQTQLKNRASPYLKKQRQQHQQTTLGRTSALNRSIQSNIKVRSGHLTKQLSPYQLYKQPRSSLSQHYDPTLQTSLHKRRQSYIQDKNESLKIAKQYYKNSNFDKCCEFLTKYLRNYSLSNEAVVQAHYLLGMSLINKGEHKNGVQALQKVLDINPQYKKTVYLIMALAYKKLSLYKDAIDVISKGLQLFPDYYDLLIYRGKMYLKEEKFQLSRNDFISAILLNKNKGFAYLGKGTCEINMKLIDQAIRTFTLGLQTDLAHICYEKRGICYYEQQYYQKSLSDLEQASSYDSYLSSALHYYKGMIYYKRKNFTEALLSFQQCLKQDNNKQLVTLAIEMMLKIKIQDKDFYEAYHLINRTENVQCDKNVIQEWRLFLEGSLFLMKKKYKQGLDAYDQLQRRQLYQKNFEAIQLESQRQRFKFIKPLIHLYKAFGYLSQNQPQKALLEYQYHTAICKSISESQENLSKKYNTLIVLASKSFPNNITTLLQQAKHLIPTKPQPYLFIAFDLLHSLRSKNLLTLNHVTEGSYQKQRTLQDIIQNLSIGISHLPQLSNNHISSFYYFRAIVELYRQEFNKAVADIDKAIQKSEDNIPKYFYLRGLIFACFGNFSQAVQDFSVAINLDEKYAKPYLQRAKCLQIQGSSNQAFIDLQKYITLAPQDPYIHKYAGFLLFQNCAYEDCLSAFSHGSQLPNDGELILTKAKCNFLLGHYSEALEHFDSFRAITSSTQFDNDTKLIKICNQIASLSSQSPNEKFSSVLSKLKQIGSLFSQDNSKIFKQRDVHQIRGSIYLIKGDYDLALEEFSLTLENFRIEKQKEFQKNLVQDPNQFEEQWSEIEIKFNMSLCYLCKKEYDLAYELVSEFAESTEKGKNWDVFFVLIEQLLMERYDLRQINLDTFEQNIRISKLWPKIPLPGTNIVLSMAFSYPFVQPPQMMPQFDLTLFEQFTMLKVEPKPEAPWINRNNSGLVFTPNIQNYDNLELSMTTKKNDDESQADDHNKPTSEIQQSISLSNSQFHLPTEDLKKKFKLDSMVQMKLNKILNK